MFLVRLEISFLQDWIPTGLDEKVCLRGVWEKEYEGSCVVHCTLKGIIPSMFKDAT